MVEIAYSNELKQKIEAKRANKLSREGKLKSNKAFHCLDPICNIPLTCTNWGKSGKRYYFKPSDNSCLHIEGCSIITSNEFKLQNEKNTGEVRNTVVNGGYIIIDKYPSRAKTQGIVSNQDNASSNNKQSSKLRKNDTKNGKVKRQNSHRSTMYSLIQLWKDNNVPHDKQFLILNGQRKSLNEIFVSLSNFNQLTDIDAMHMFYGEARIFHSNEGPACFEFDDFHGAILYANYEHLRKRPATAKINKYILSKNPVTVYFRGSLEEVDGRLKFWPFNTFLYQDIYIDD